LRDGIEAPRGTGTGARIRQAEPGAGSEPRPSVRRIAITLLMVVVMVCNVALTAGAPQHTVLIAGACLALLCAMEYPRIAPGMRRTGTAMCVAAAIVLALTPEPLFALERGLRSSIAFVSLVAAVSILGARAVESGFVRRIGNDLGSVAAQGRYAPLAGVAAAVGSGLSLAGVAVLTSSLSRDETSPAEMRLACSAILRGFCTAICWTPMMGNSALLLAIYGGMDWPDIALPCGLIALSMVSSGILFERLRRGPGERASGPLPIGSLILRSALMLVVAVPILLLASRALGLPIGPTIVVMAVPVAMVWALIERHARPARVPGRVASDALARFPNFGGEALLFLGAGVASSAIATFVPEGLVAAVGGWLLGSAGLFCLAASLVMGGLTMVGLHPVLTALLIATALPPEGLGVPVTGHFAALLGAWGLATSVGPFTIVGLMVARVAGRPSPEVTVGWNLPFFLFTAPCMALAVEALVRLGIAA